MCVCTNSVSMCRVCVYVCVCFRLGTSVLVVVSVCIHERTHARTRLFTHMQGHSGEKSGRECPGSLWLLGLALRSWCVSGGVCVVVGEHAQASADMRHRILSMQLTCKCTYGMCACVRARAVRVTGGGRVEAVRLLLQYGADANARSS